VVEKDTALTTGDGKDYFVVPDSLDGKILTDAHAAVDTVSSSGKPTVQIRNVTDSQDMLAVPIRVDASEYTSYTAETLPDINATYDDVATGDRIAADVDAKGTDTKGLLVILEFGDA
jgi:fructose-1,6-bisphosphatase